MNTDAKVYLKKMNLNTTYWGNKIIVAEKRGHFTVKDADEAASWVTCACGKVTEDIPRDPQLHDPLDIYLREMGNTFHDFVVWDDFLEAAHNLNRIEKRAMEVAMENAK
jgi:hypothetical protein